MKKIPRDIKGSDLAKLLGKTYGYVPTRQSGSHIRLTTQTNGEHHITIPDHSSIKIGTLSAILFDIALHQQKSKEQVISELF